MDVVLNFDKSFQQRLQEYQDVLSGYEVLPASALSKEWGYYLELTIDPNGWQAIWKITRATCEELKIPFPTVVLVFVLNVDFANLEAVVKIIAVQDDNIHIPEKHLVPLTQLWPTKVQDSSIALNITSTANALDSFRFFYMYIFMPWDLEDDNTSDWKLKHLESRLRLHYDMKNGVIPKATSARLNSLLSEARRLQTKKELIEIEIEDKEMNEEYNGESIDELADIHLKLLEIKNEVEILENPLFRKAFMKRQGMCVVNTNSEEAKIRLISKNDVVSNYIEFLEQVKLLYPNEEVIFESNLSSITHGGSNDTFILNYGKYDINVVGALENGGTLKGLGAPEKTILCSNLDHIMLDFQVSQCLVENITIDATASQCAVLIRRGKVKFVNCKLFGDSKSTHQGIIVLVGGEVELVNCEIYGFYTALVGNSGSKIVMQNTEIHNVNYGLKTYDNVDISLQKCTFRDCKDHGVCVETENNLKGNRQKVGTFEILKIIPGVTTEYISGMNNLKGDVLINQAAQITAMDDLFSNIDPTVSEPSEEEMLTEEEGNDFEKLRGVSPATV